MLLLSDLDEEGEDDYILNLLHVLSNKEHSSWKADGSFSFNFVSIILYSRLDFS
jgi:hypothetical protein